MNSSKNMLTHAFCRKHHWTGLLVAVLFVAPLIWLLLGSLQLPGQSTGPLPLLPNPFTLANYVQIFQLYDLAHPLLNSALIALITMSLTIISASAAGFALAQLPGRLRQPLVLMTMALMVVPLPALWLPRFVIFSAIGWVDNLMALIVPSLMGSSPFFVLLYYLTFRRISVNLFDAAHLDGAGHFKTWWRVALPLARTTTTVVTVLTFALYWNDYMNALIYIRSEALYTLSLRLQQFMTQDIGHQPLAMAAAVLAIVPVLLSFLWIQRNIWPDTRS